MPFAADGRWIWSPSTVLPKFDYGQDIFQCIYNWVKGNIALHWLLMCESVISGAVGWSHRPHTARTPEHKGSYGPQCQDRVGDVQGIFYSDIVGKVDKSLNTAPGIALYAPHVVQNVFRTRIIATYSEKNRKL